MEVTVKMTADEFIGFMKWRSDKEENDREIRRMGSWLEELAEKVVETVEPCDDSDEPEYRLKSRQAAENLVAAAAEVFA